MLSVGSIAPDFELPSHDGSSVKLSQVVADSVVVLFFYPKDETPGCTRELCTLRDRYELFVEAGAEVLGISADDVASHRAFADRHGFGFRLLADVDKRVRNKYQVKDSIPFLLPGRETFVLDKKRVIRHQFASQLSVYKHVDEALKVVEQIQREGAAKGAT